MEKVHKVLLIENEEIDAQTVMKFLMESASKFQIAHVKTLSGALEKLEEESFDIALMNLMLPDSGGVYGLTKLLERRKFLPIVVVNGPNDDGLFENSIMAGAQDYLSKGTIGTNSLRKSIVAALLRTGSHKQATEELKSEEKSAQISSLAEMAKDVANDLEAPLSSMKQTLSELKNVTERRDELSPKEVRKLLQEAETVSDDFMTIVSDLRRFWKDLAEDPLFRGRDRKDYRILCVDDEPEILEIMSEALNSCGYVRIDTAGNGIEAYNKAVASVNARNQYDLVISDWKMPKMTGLELLEKLRLNHYFRETPFMMVTALDEKDKIEQAARARVSDYCIKPFQRDNLVKRVDRLRLLNRN